MPLMDLMARGERDAKVGGRASELISLGDFGCVLWCRGLGLVVGPDWADVTTVAGAVKARLLAVVAERLLVLVLGVLVEGTCRTARGRGVCGVRSKKAGSRSDSGPSHLLRGTRVSRLTLSTTDMCGMP